MLDKPWYPGVAQKQQPLYKHVVDCTYWYVLGSFDNWNITQFKNKNRLSEYFYQIHNVAIDGISDNMVSLVQTGKYGAINASYPATMVYYVVKYVYAPFYYRKT